MPRRGRFASRSGSTRPSWSSASVTTRCGGSPMVPPSAVQAKARSSGCRRDEAEPVEAGGEDRDAVGRHPAGGGAEAGHAARRGGDPRAARGVGGEREQGGAGGDRDRRATARAAGAAGRVARVARARRERAEAELVRAGLADDHRARLPQPRDDRRVALRHAALAPPERGRQPGDVDQVLDRDGDAVERSARPAGEGFGRAARAFLVDVDEGAMLLGRPEVRKAGIEDLERGDVSGGEPRTARERGHGPTRSSRRRRPVIVCIRRHECRLDHRGGG